MITLLRILTMVLFRPTKYRLISTATTNGIIIVGCGEPKEIQEFQDLIEKKHLEHLASSGVDKTPKK